MEYLLNSEEMRSCDRRTEEVFGVPSIVLMERAPCPAWRLFWIWQTGLMRAASWYCAEAATMEEMDLPLPEFKRAGSWYGDPFRWKRREADEKCQNPENDL